MTKNDAYARNWKGTEKLGDFTIDSSIAIVYYDSKERSIWDILRDFLERMKVRYENGADTIPNKLFIVLGTSDTDYIGLKFNMIDFFGCITGRTENIEQIIRYVAPEEFHGEDSFLGEYQAITDRDDLHTQIVMHKTIEPREII